MAMTKRECPACKQVKTYRSDVKTCGCQGTNPTLSAPKVVEKKTPASEKERIDLALQALRDKKEGKDVRIAALQERVVQLEQELNTLATYRELTVQASEILPHTSSGTSESAAVVVWSDHHSEELVLPGQVSGRNEFNLEIYDRRFSQLVHGTLAWLNIEQQKTSIKTLVIALLGDYFTNNIHEDAAESNLLAPMDAAYNAQNHLIGGINYILEHTPKDLELLIVCHSGNHARTTKKQRIATEAGNSLEHYMYYVMRDHYKNNPRVEFQIAKGYHSYVTFFGSYTVRFHHGHQINYQGGVGGLTIPVNKSIAQWNKARQANLDVFGHFHTRFDGGNFIANGSLIGYNAYAVAIKASYEKPSQTFFLINKKYLEKSMTATIYLL
jgi:hypothetical protein